MYSVEINKILSRNKITYKFFRGCYSADKIPLINSGYPFCMVINTDPSYLEGTHWVAVFVNNKNSVDYYDSFGGWPSVSLHINNYLKNFKKFNINTTILQSYKAKNCGKHVIYFLYFRCRGKSFKAIINSLKIKADNIVNRFVYLLQKTI